jgi:hypothetical protein
VVVVEMRMPQDYPFKPPDATVTLYARGTGGGDGSSDSAAPASASAGVSAAELAVLTEFIDAADDGRRVPTESLPPPWVTLHTYAKTVPPGDQPALWPEKLVHHLEDDGDHKRDTALNWFERLAKYASKPTDSDSSATTTATTNPGTHTAPALAP